MKNNKVCIVTGASRGLGRGIALVLAQEEGCTVYATARNENALDSLAEEAAKGTKGGVVKVCVLDQLNDDAVQDFVEQVKSEENQIDLLVSVLLHLVCQLYLDRISYVVYYQPS